MTRLRWLTAAVALVLAAGALAALTRPSPEEPRYVTDDRGRALVLHGLNTAGSTKSDPASMPWIEREDVAREYATMGTNFVRFLLQWSAVEPRPGEYDEEYLDDVAERVSWYADHGYHVLLDMHQDLWGPAITEDGDVGNGAPAWATHTDGLPVRERAQWELVYLEPGTVRAFDHFWNTTGEHPELMDRYARAWRHVAERFADEPAVIGYDLMNEPFGGTLQGPAFERGPLAALYQRCIDRIRAVDQDAWVFVEPQAVGVNWSLPSALPHLDDPRDGRARIAYAPHLYPLPMDLGQPYDGEGRAWVDRSLDAWRTNVRTTADRLDAPVVLGEFGLDMTRPGAGDYMRRVLALTDDMGAGRAYWSNDPGAWGPWEGEDMTPGTLADVLNRPYPRAIAGDPEEVRYDPTASTLTVRFTEKAGVSGPTEIYLPEDEFPKGGRVTSSDPDGSWSATWDEKRRILSVRADPDTAEHELTVTPAR